MKTIKILIFLFLASLLSCSSSSKPVIYKKLPPKVIYKEVEENKVPGTETKVWVEKQINDIEVPAQLDPDGVYYIPSHTEIVEIYQGRSQKVVYPEDEKKSKDQGRMKEQGTFDYYAK